MATESAGAESETGFLSEEQLERARIAYYRFTQSFTSVIGLLMVLSVIFMALFAPFIAPYPGATDSTDFGTGATAPSLDHPMGPDDTGRDILSRVIFGSRISLMIGAVVLTLAISIGTTLGLIAGYLGGPVNSVIMRTSDVFLSIPPIVLAMAVIAALGQSLLFAIVAISFSWWAWYARLVQGEVLSVKEENFVEASKAMGAGWTRIAFKEVLPNVTGPIIVKATLDMGFAILVAASLSFLGLGSQPPTPDWGTMVASGRSYVTSFWWISVFPGLAISYTVLGFNLLGDGLRDLFDVEVN
jgi:peptide/nickel transport system permease protein